MPGTRVYDPSKLHLKKELTQIRKSARALRDPGTSSSLKSPLSPTRSATAAVFAQNSTSKLKNSPLSIRYKEGEREKEKSSVLCNWRSNNKKSSSEKSLTRVDLDGGNHNNDAADGSSSISAELDDCLGDATNRGGAGDSESETSVDICHGDGRLYGRRPRPNHGGAHYTMGFKCGSTKLASIGSPAMARRAVGKMKFRKSVHSSSIHKQRRKRLKEVVVDKKSLSSKLAQMDVARSSSIGLSQDDSVSLIDKYDDTSKWYNSEDLCNSSATSPLLSRLMQKNFPQSSKKMLRGGRRGDSSYTYSTPALSTSSFNRYFNYINPISSGSWDGNADSLSGVEDEADDSLELPVRQGCGIPCYWSRKSTPKYRGSYGCSSPSFSDTLLRKGSMILCGSQKGSHKRHGSLSSMGKQKIASGAAQGRLPLLNSYGASSSGTGNSDDERSINFGELDLEGMSRLDGRRWSISCRSEEGLELMALAGNSQDENMSLSQKYRPIFFNELVGQNIVVQSLTNAITRGRIAPVYLFQGPRGTGKTSTAKIFAAALNCLGTEGTKPCGICQKCSNSLSCRSRDMMEVNGTNKKGIDSVRYLLKKLAVAPPSAASSYKVFVIDECHLLPSKTWAVLLKFLEDPLPQVVFIFITTDVENMPRSILSRCQKLFFNKIKDAEIVSRLQRIAVEDNLDFEPDALELISLNADGSLRDAETMLEQLSLLGKRITATLVNELVGVVSDEKLLELLELAISSNTAATVKRARELLDSGADPLVLMSQLASLIMDIIAGNYLLDGAECNSSYYGGRSLTEEELEKFKNALKLLSEAEKQLRVCSERSTWFTATLLQLGSFTSPEFTLSGSSNRRSSKTTDEDQSATSRDGPEHILKMASTQLLLTDGINSNSGVTHHKALNSLDKISFPGDLVDGQISLSKSDMEKLHHLWLQCIGRCHYEKLRQLLQTYGKLVSLSEVNGVLLAYIAFGDGNIKARAERYLISITNSLEAVLRRSVEVRIIVLPDGLIPVETDSINKDEKLISLKNSPFSTEANGQVRGTTKIPMQRIESIIREQRLETAWLQAVEKGATPRSLNRLRPERNQVLPQDSAVYAQNQGESMNSVDLSSQHWDELNREFKALKVNDKKAGEKVEHLPISPSLLHQSSCAGGNLSKEYQGYESGAGGKGCNILFCCYNRRHRKGKVNQGSSPIGQHKGGGRSLCFEECWKSRHS